MIIRFFKSLSGIKQPRTLSEWLAIATRNLVPSAKARVRPEIETHYAEAIQSHLNSGLSESAAKTAALAELGSPKTAGRCFRRKHLTISDRDNIRSYLSLRRNLLFTSAGFLIALGCAHLIWSLPPKYQYWEIILEMPLALSFFAARLATYLIAQRAPTIANLRRLLLFLSLPNLIFVFAMVAESLWRLQAYLHHVNLPFDSLKLIDWIGMFYAPYFFGDTFLYLLRLRAKLGSAREDDLPPPNSSIA